MSHHQLREEKNCLNCGTIVEDRFCPHCGQENIVNRPSFHYLFAHFFEDLFHYDSGFWKTMKFLMLKPGRMVKEYLAGKRKTYVPPVKLYIFISFVTFFVPFILPDFGGQEEEKAMAEQISENQKNQNAEFEGIEVGGFKNIKTVQQLDSLQNSLPEGKKISDFQYAIYQKTLEAIEKNAETPGDLTSHKNEEAGERTRIFSEEGINMGKYRNVKTVKDLDSIDSSLPKNERLGWFSKRAFKKLLDFREREVKGGENLTKEFTEAFVHNLPKALFFYLPVFAFFLWLFHNKKKWLYYDHGIFTLYYFSFLLILITLNVLVDWIFTSLAFLVRSDSMSLIENIVVVLSGSIGWFFMVFSFFYAIFYFFRAHSRVYGEKKYISRLKGFALFWINLIFISLVLVVYTVLTIVMI